MGRAPCCEKLGLKKGPWTPDEDQILINYIRLHGHSNWRALPKLAGLLRCGKSCRLRWTNYLRPDIKRGSFTPQEEDTIIQLHQMLGNKWSAIAAKLPGRTDNEIKNVWHSHLKKRLPKPITNSTPDGPISEPTRKRARKPKPTKNDAISKKSKSEQVDVHEYNIPNNDDDNDDDLKNKKESRDTMSPQPCCSSEMSTITSSNTNANETNKRDDDCENFVDEINDDFWLEVLSVEDTAMSTEDLSRSLQCDQNTLLDQLMIEPIFDQLSSKVNDDDVDFFWFNLLTRSDDHEFSQII